MSKNVWLLTEERPKRSVVLTILNRLCQELKFVGQENNLQIIPVMSASGKFTFVYKVIGFEAEEIKEIFIVPVSGYSSFVDYVVFYQDEIPKNRQDNPVLLIEETKTDDSESRNTGVYQRCSKFVFSEFFYPDSVKIMLYSLKIPQKTNPTQTYIFGTKMLKTIGVEIIGKKLNDDLYQPFKTVEELMTLKNAMPLPNNGVGVRFTQKDNTIFISAKLEKNSKLNHDPNIGMVAMMSACLRYLGWAGRIVIVKHGLPGQGAIGNKNKFNYIAHLLNIELEDLVLPNLELPEEYWQLEKQKEKTGTIFAHVIMENLAGGMLVYENHGGCERGYFTAYSNGQGMPVVIPKYTDKVKYKAGDKTAIVYIPDLVFFDKSRNEVINIEGKTYKNRDKGILELKNFDFFETAYVRKYYAGVTITRSIILAGSGNKDIAKSIPQLSLYIDDDGSIIVGQSASELLRNAVKKLKSS
jgi:hypothetical protein